MVKSSSKASFVKVEKKMSHKDPTDALVLVMEKDFNQSISLRFDTGFLKGEPLREFSNTSGGWAQRVSVKLAAADLCFHSCCLAVLLAVTGTCSVPCAGAQQQQAFVSVVLQWRL